VKNDWPAGEECSHTGNNHKVWIECERDDDPEVNVERAQLLTNMLNKLGGSGRFEYVVDFNLWKGEDVHWFYYIIPKAKQGEFLFISSDGSFCELPDNGHWFSLSYLGRDHLR